MLMLVLILMMQFCINVELMVLGQMIHAGFSTTTTAQVLNRTVQAVRHLEKLAFNYLKTSRVYRLATAQATLLNKDVEPMCI